MKVVTAYANEWDLGVKTSRADMNSEIDFYSALSKHITEILTESGDLPYTSAGFVFRKLEAVYSAPNSGFAGLVYTNDYGDTYNIEENYGAAFGGIIKLSEVLPKVWDKLTYDEQTMIMAIILGSKK